MEAPAPRFILYVSEPKTPQDNEALYIAGQAPEGFRRMVQVMRISGQATPLLEDRQAGARSSSSDATLVLLQQLVASAQTMATRAKDQALRREQLIAGVVAPPRVAPSASGIPPAPHPGQGPLSYPRPPVPTSGGSGSAASGVAEPTFRQVGGLGIPGGTGSLCGATGLSQGFASKLSDTFLLNPHLDSIPIEELKTMDPNGPLMQERRRLAFQNMLPAFGAQQFGVNSTTLSSPPTQTIPQFNDKATPDMKQGTYELPKYQPDGPVAEMGRADGGAAASRPETHLSHAPYAPPRYERAQKGSGSDAWAATS